MNPVIRTSIQKLSAAATAQSSQIEADRAQPFFDAASITFQDDYDFSRKLNQLPVIEPQFSIDGQFVMDASKYTIDCSKMDADTVHSSNQSLRDEMHQKFHDIGLVYLTNTGLSEFQSMRDLVTILIPSEMNMEYKGMSSHS